MNNSPTISLKEENAMLETAAIFQNHMILQQGKPVPVWGAGEPGTTVHIAIQNQLASAQVTQDGTWKATLAPLSPSWGETMRITDGFAQLSLTDVAVGEVWVAGGQSNMEFYMRYEKYREAEFAACPQPNLRFYDVPEICYPEQLQDFDYSRMGVWRTATREDVEYFSAVGYYFQKALAQNLDMPVGIIGCNWGGSSSSAWMNPASVAAAGYPWMKEYEDYVAATDMSEYWDRQRKNPLNGRGNPFHNTYEEVVYPGIPEPEVLDAYFASVSGEECDFLGMMPKQIPGILYENMLKVTAPFAVRGVIWYQGESDDVPGRQQLYCSMMTALIHDWRELWADASLPFLIVQLPGYRDWMDVPAHDYPAVRRCQEEVTKTVPNTWLCSISDRGEEWDIHPKDKKAVGQRLALLARGHVYGEDILCDAPEAAVVSREGSSIQVSFTHAEGGLTVHGDRISALRITSENAEIPFTAEVKGDTVDITLEYAASGPVTLSFAQENWFCVNLYNQTGIPALPFEVTVL